MRKGEPTPNEMYRAVRELGEALRVPGDNQGSIIGKIVEEARKHFPEAKLSERSVRSYFHREARQNHQAHLDLFNELKSKVSSNEIQELRDRLDRLERALDEERARNRRSSTFEGWASFGKFGRTDSPLAG